MSHLNWPVSQQRPLVLIANPENRRVTMFCAAAHKLGLQTPRIVSYEELLTRDEPLLAEHALAGAVIRVESPGENAIVAAHLIRRGGRLLAQDHKVIEDAVAAAHEHGRVLRADLWHAGFCDLLEKLTRELAESQVRWMNHPADISQMFDKTACQEKLESLGIATPRPLTRTESQTPRCYDELKQLLFAASATRVFVKPRYGSSASGVVALEFAKSRVLATTSMEVAPEAERPKLFNSLHIRRYTCERDIAVILDELCRQAVHVEHWIPKASLDGRVFDLRVLVIAGEVRHKVMRTSSGPLTNLHLGNRRGDLAGLLAVWPEDQQTRAWHSCQQAAAAFPSSLYCGIDLVLTTSLRQHAILEVNAFGDLLPGIVDRHQESYAAELQAAFQLPIPNLAIPSL